MEPNLEQIASDVKATMEAMKQWQATNGDKFVKWQGDVDRISAIIEKQESRLESIEKALKERVGGILPGLEDEVEKNGDLSIWDALTDPDSRSRSIAKEYTARKLATSPEAAKRVERTMVAGSDALGGFWVPSQTIPGFVPQVRSRSVVWQGAGLTILDNVTGFPLEIPREVGTFTPEDLDENEAATAQDVGAGQLIFRPRRIGGLVKMSNRLLNNSDLAERIVREGLQKDMALFMDLRILRGSGSEKQCLGVANTPGISAVEIGDNGGAFTYATAAAMQLAVEEADLLDGTPKYISRPYPFHSLRMERIAQYSGDTGGDYVLQMPMSDQVVRDWLGVDFLKTTVLPKTLTKGTGTGLTEVYYGVWSHVWLAIWQDLFISMSKETGDSSGSAWTQNQLWIKADMEYDVQMDHPAAICLVNDANGAAS